MAVFAFRNIALRAANVWANSVSQSVGASPGSAAPTIARD
jgi:hypothetical protein